MKNLLGVVALASILVCCHASSSRREVRQKGWDDVRIDAGESEWAVTEIHYTPDQVCVAIEILPSGILPQRPFRVIGKVEA